MAFKYPATRRADTVSLFHGHKVDDPYRWLEDPDSKETKEWVAAQNSVSQQYLEQCGERGQINAHLTAMMDYPRYGCVFKAGTRYFHHKNDGLQNQAPLMVQRTLTSKARVFFDPNKLSKDGTVAMGSFSFSKDGSMMAYGLSRSGSDWLTVHVRTVDDDVSMCKTLEDEINWVKFSALTWTHDNKGFFYSRYPAPAKVLSTEGKTAGSETDANEFHKLYYHVVGTPQDADVLVYEDATQPTWMFGARVTDDGETLLISVSESTAPVNQLYVASIKDNLARGKGPWKVTKVIDNFDAEYSYVSNAGDEYTFKTNLDAPRYRVVRFALAQAKNPAAWTTVVPQAQQDVLQYAVHVSGHLVLIWLRDVKEILALHQLKTGQLLREMDLPGLGSIAGLSGKHDDPELFFKFTSFLVPGDSYVYDFRTDATKLVLRSDIKGVDPAALETEQVFYPSKDGTRIPMFIVGAKGMRGARRPTWLYGYGGFSISLTPSFSVSRLAYIVHFGGIVAVPNLRGGGEYGEQWHEAGTKERKQNVFDDFIAAAEYLIKNKYSETPTLTINGGSNGGLLVGACTNQRPELFGAAVAQVGVMDMLRFHRFTIGKAWCADYGNADESEDQFKYLYAYSPVHNVRPGKAYPAVLLMTADHDDRVSPGHSLKYAAALQHTLGNQEYQKKPLLIRIETKAGHGAGKPTSKSIEETTDVFAFISLACGIKWTQ